MNDERIWRFATLLAVIAVAVLTSPMVGFQPSASWPGRGTTVQYGPVVAEVSNPCTDHDLFWSHVYNPSRLEVQADCAQVTGVIVDATAGKRKDGVRHESDGDCHGWLHLDSGQGKYLNAGNLSDEGGNLVFEIQCLYPVIQADAKAACVGWHSQLKVPAVGSHVRLTGTWVKDDNHAKWFEIHPVMSIDVLN